MVLLCLAALALPIFATVLVVAACMRSSQLSQKGL